MSTPFGKSKRTPRTPPLSPSPSPTPTLPKTPSTPRVKSVAEQKSEKKKKEEKRKMDAQLKALVKQREAVRGKLFRVRAALRDSEEEPNPNVRNVHFLQLQKRALENIYGECNEVQNKIYALPLSEDQDIVQTEKYVEFEGVFNDVSLKLSTLIDVVPKAEPAAPAAGAPVQQPAQHYLPPLQVPLPKFDGSYEKWYAFKALFTTLMNRYRQEEPALKLYHLRDCLVEKAAGIIDDEMINNNDYDAAWALLTLRYEDKRIVVDKLVEKLYGLPKISQEDAAELRKVIDTCTKNVDALRNQELPVAGLGEQMLINLIVGKMEKKLQLSWEALQKKNVLSTYAALMAFLEEQCRISEKLDTKVKPVKESAKPKTAGRSHTLAVSDSRNELKCPVCKAAHELWKCEVFKNKSVSDKYEILKKCGACFNCLMKGHRTRACSSGSCRHCGKKHHSSLHEDSPSQVANSAAPTTPASEVSQTINTPAAGTSTTLCVSAASSEKQTVLSTAVVLVDGKCSTPIPCRVLLDSASQMNFVTERFANLLSLKLKPADYTVSGLNGNKTRISRRLRATIRSRHGNFAAELDFLVTPRITGELPVKSFDASEWPISSELVLADPAFNKRGRVDMLIGAEYFWNLLLDGRYELGPDRPVLRNTKLGWIAGGVIASDATVVARTLCQTSEEEPLIELLKSFYKVEACDEIRSSPTADDEMCLEHFQRTHERTEEGRYVVRHPFNERKRELGDSREMALRRFLALERKLDKQPELKEQYSQFIREYEQLGHMREIEEAPNEDPGSAFYLPHHCVLRPTSTTTKLRVVFDGSAKTSTGVSINDVLRIGPTIQNDLTAILLRFRGFQFVLTLDIPKMFRQVRVHPEETRYQRIFWRYDRNDFLTVRELLTVTYGLGPSPFQATMALKQAAADHEDEFPRAAEVVDKGTYMDDVLTGADTLAEACELQREMTGLLAKACFGAHKWCANHSDLLREVPEELRGNSFEVTDDSSKTIVKTLGVTWNPFEDWFSVSVPDFDDLEEVTRRKLLSQLAKIFDPLGFFGPVITYAKLILREVGELHIEWDDPVPTDIGEKWRSFRIELTALREVRLPRWISWKGALKLELHGYADASDLAYGACIYVKGFFANEETEMRLICSKSRILPKKRKPKEKTISTPRAELLAALLLARMVVKFLSATELKFESVHLWSDSQIVLAWLKKLPQLLQTFVSNRKLIKSKKWWQGRPRTTVAAAADEIVIPDDELPEMRTGVVLAMTVPVERFPMFDKLSSFTEIVRSMAYLVRLARFVKSRKTEVVKGRLTAKEMRTATLVIVRLVQREAFQPEILALMDGADTNHRLNGLKAFLDPDDGLLRVGGRIKRAFVPYDSRHQMLLPAKHPITEALVRELHVDNLHIGQRGLLAVVRQRFWPLNVKSTIRQVIRKCIVCFKANPLKTTQLMGDLPSYRVQPAPVFSNTGVDYAGPFWIKASSATRKPQITKAYVCLFVCLQTRAIHLELVSDLTTDAFLASLRRFASRRGCPKTMHSDNGTNFVGAKTELHELWQMFQNECATKKITSYCVEKGIEWSFIPPRSPHFGGIWEAGVKQVKHHLKRIVGERKLSYEELYTTLTQIEAVLNSRPLVPSSDDPSDYTAITPAHFLIGREMQAVPEPDYSHLKENRLSRWQLVQTMLQHFWRRWTAEYLPELQNRSKWLKTKVIKEGSLVLLVDQNAPPLQWPLGRIVTAHPGEDGVTRVVTVRMANGAEFKRAVTEVCLLPLDEDED
ncbi:uncharacterized protein LOC119766466 [Culex quinquefasciatus]|uniref:uncharacterized protein LOC119766466 n=1 Tax=Culex quinquefasciatus TaxID=7176 RepID=UPI0018E2AED6|nr:uncharacterized protein LOC119766466 [Culex quinquefasciatus]